MLWIILNLKNQSEIILSMLHRFKIKDKFGKEVLFFDGSGFPAYKPGTLELKDEFKYNIDGSINKENIGWENFTLDEVNPTYNQFFLQTLKIEDAIKKIQGNYADRDSIQIMNNTYGKLLMTFMRWLPEHLNQRYGKREIDLIQGTENTLGRHRSLLSNAGALTIYGSIGIGATMGPTIGMIGGGGLVIGLMGTMLYQKIANNKTLKDSILDAHVTLGFMQEILQQTVNLPLKLTYGNQSNKVVKYITKNDLLNNSKTLSKSEIAGLKGMAQESAIALGMTMLIIGLIGLVSDDEDDTVFEKEMKRQLRNTIDNLGNRCINELLKFSNPAEMVNSNSQFAMLRTISDGQKALKAINDYYTVDKGSASELVYKIYKVQPFIPIPNSLMKPLSGSYFLLDKEEYQKGQWFDKKEGDAEETILKK